MEHKTLLGAVGEKDAVLAFKAIGVKAVPATTQGELQAAVHRLVQEGVRVIFITETAARQVPELMARYDVDAQISLIPVPGTAGTDGLGQQRLRDNVLRAIGADILMDNDRKEG